METFIPKFFLSANSSEGFLSHFSDSYDTNSDWHAYILKGGPGTGKSTFMKKLSGKALEKGIKHELIFCSSDPASLDGVIFPTLKKIILDGTNPHLVTPKYPGACETEIDFSVNWNDEKLIKNKDKIKEKTDKNKAYHKAASLYLKAAGQPLLDNFNIAQKSFDCEKALKFAEKLAKNNIPKSKDKSFEWKRFICGNTPSGEISFKNELINNYNHIIIEDDFGPCVSLILEHIRSFALYNNHEIITLKNHILPSYITEGIIIPKLNLSFLRKTKADALESETRIIHSARFYDSSFLSSHKQRIKLNKKLSKELFNTAYSLLRKALASHDEIEKYYIDAINFDALNKFTENKIREIL